MRRAVLFSLFLLIPALLGANTPPKPGRYVYEGDGKIAFTNAHTGRHVNVTYRLPDGTYPAGAIAQLNAVFGVPANFGENYSLRTVSFIDYLEDKFSPKKTIRINSGYRSPDYNNKIRKRGGKAAETSYHLDAMAADVVFPGANPKEVWEFARGLSYGGSGYYGGPSLHLDTGKPRFWTSETALSKKKEPPLNKNIYFSIDKDVYWPGEQIQMFFSGISNYPFGVKSVFKLDRKGHDKIMIHPRFSKPTNPNTEECVVLNDRADTRQIYWTIPRDLEGSYQKWSIEVEFCSPTYEKMPQWLTSRAFEIQKPQ